MLEYKARQIVAERSSGTCEVCGQQRAVHAHHRWLKGQGGPWCPANLIHICLLCHDRIHANVWVSISAGWIVPRPPIESGSDSVRITGGGNLLPCGVRLEHWMWGAVLLDRDGAIAVASG